MRAETVSNYGVWVKGCTLQQALRRKEVTIIFSWRDWYSMTLVSICAAPQLIVTKASYWCASPYNGIPAWHPCSTELWKKNPTKSRNIQWASGLADSTMLSLLCLNVSFERAMAWLANSSKPACGHITSPVSLWSCFFDWGPSRIESTLFQLHFHLCCEKLLLISSLDVFTCLP